MGSGGQVPVVGVVGSPAVRGGSQCSQVNGSAGGIPSRAADCVSIWDGDGRSMFGLLEVSSVGAKAVSVSV